MKIGYARVSTKAKQTFTLQDAALEKAGVLAENIYRDKISGKKSSRPGLDHCLSVLRKGDVLYVYKLDRLARNTKHLLQLAERFVKDGIDLVTLSGPKIDTTSAFGKFQYTMLSAISEFERELIRERSIAGMETAREQGRIGGRPRLFTAAKMREAIEVYVERKETSSLKETAEKIGINRHTLARYMKVNGDIKAKGKELLEKGDKDGV